MNEDRPSEGSQTPANDGWPARAEPSMGRKMDILEETKAVLNKEPEGASQLVEMVKGWIDRAAAMAHVAVDKTAASVVPLAQAASTAKASTIAKAQDVKENVGVVKEQWVEDTKSAVRERPLTAVGIAALAGIAITLIFFSGSDSDSE